MHTITTSNVTFNFNSDLSGEVFMHFPAMAVQPQRARGNLVCISITADDLLAFAAEVVRRQRIHDAESEGDYEVLGIRHAKRLGVELVAR